MAKLTRLQRHFRSACHKVKRQNRDMWSGYLTPMEIKSLIEMGVRLQDDYRKRQYERVLHQIKEGDCSPTWFSFPLGKVTLDLG